MAPSAQLPLQDAIIQLVWCGGRLAGHEGRGTSLFQVQLRANPHSSKAILHRGARVGTHILIRVRRWLQMDLKKEMIISLVKLVMTVNTPAEET